MTSDGLGDMSETATSAAGIVRVVSSAGRVGVQRLAFGSPPGRYAASTFSIPPTGDSVLLVGPTP